jgi:hypothetical protein
MLEKLETPDELVARWKCPKSWLYARTRERGDDAIPRVKMGKYLRFIPEQVDNWLLKRAAS